MKETTLNGKYIKIVGKGLSDKSASASKKFLFALERRMKWRWFKPIQKDISIHITEKADNLYVSFQTVQAREFYKQNSNKLMNPVSKCFPDYKMVSIGVDLDV